MHTLGLCKPPPSQRKSRFAGLAVLAALGLTATGEAAAFTCEREVTADVVAMDQPILFNRLGASNVNGMIFALRRDVVDMATGLPEAAGGTLSAGFVELDPTSARVRWCCAYVRATA